MLHGHIAKSGELLVISQCDRERCLVARFIETGKCHARGGWFKMGN